MSRPCLAFVAVLAMLACSLSAPVIAVEPSEELLPAYTKGFLSIPDVDLLRSRWDTTQLGQLMNDPVMAPFIEDVKRQIRTKLNRTDSQLGITWEDLEGVYSGEVSIAVLQPWDEALESKKTEESIEKDVAAARERGETPQRIEEIRASSTRREYQQQEKERRARRAMVLLVDVSGKLDEAQQLLDKIAEKFAARGGTRAKLSISGIEAELHRVPGEQELNVLYCIHEGQLVATDNATVAEEVLGLLAGSELPTLAESPAFVAAMERGAESFEGASSNLRWFIEPFGYVEVSRAYEGGRRRRGTDFLQVLANQGFTAVQGVGGHVAFATERHEILYRTFVFAPAVERPADSESKDKYDLAANILNFANKPPRDPDDWVPATLSGYLTFNWRMKEAFEYIGTLVDEVVGDEVFEDVLKSIEADPSGPQINIRKDLVNHLAEQVTMVSDYAMPITPKSERLLFAIEVADPAAVMQTVNKAMESDPAARRREHNQHVVWEILSDPPIEVEAVKIDGGGIGFGFDEPELVEEETEKPLIPNAAVTVAYGQLLVATNIDYLKEVLSMPAEGEKLQNAADFKRVDAELNKLGMDVASSRFFTRTSEAYRPTYELTRMGKMPESESVFGKVLNRIWAPAEEGELRQQHVDGSKMPPFEAIQKYLGPGGFYSRSVDDGWTIVGCLLNAKAEE